MSQISLVNDTEDSIRIAIFRKPVRTPSLGNFAWVVAEPAPKGGKTEIEVDQPFEVFVVVPNQVEYRTDPNAGGRTPAIDVGDFTSHFQVQPQPVSHETSETVKLVQVDTGRVPGEMRIDNDSGLGVWTHIQQDGHDIYPPQVLSPGSTFLAAQPKNAYYLAVISGSSGQGSLLSEEEISSTLATILPGQTATVTGSLWKGFDIRVGSDAKGG